MKTEGLVKVTEKQSTYILFKAENGGYIFLVFCGGIAVVDRTIQLNSEEISNFQSDGEYFLDQLRRDICRDYEKYEPRLITSP